MLGWRLQLCSCHRSRQATFLSGLMSRFSRDVWMFGDRQNSRKWSRGISSFFFIGFPCDSTKKKGEQGVKSIILVQNMSVIFIQQEQPVHFKSDQEWGLKCVHFGGISFCFNLCDGVSLFWLIKTKINTTKIHLGAVKLV